MFHRMIPLLPFLLFAAPNVWTEQLQEAPKPAQTAQETPAPATGNLSTHQARQESWTELTLAKSGLSPTAYKVMQLSKSEQPEYTSELLRVEWRSGDPIDLYVVLPHGVAKPPAILYLYDYTADTDRFRNDHWCKQATQGGFAAIGFVSALSGQRFHAPRPMKEWFVSELQEALATSAHDVQMILNYLDTRGDIDVSKAGMYGQGSGGAIAVLAAEADPRIAVLDLLNPWGDWPEWLKDSPQIPENERAIYLKPEFLQSVSILDPVLYLPQMKMKGLRIQQIMDDTTTPPSARDRIAAATPRPDQVTRYKDRSAHLNAWRANGLNGWLRQQLQPVPTESRQTAINQDACFVLQHCLGARPLRRLCRQGGDASSLRQ